MRSINTSQSSDSSNNFQQQQQQQPTTQVFYANVGGNIQQISGVKNGNKSIKLLMNMQQQANNTNTIINTPNNTVNVFGPPASPANNGSSQLDKISSSVGNNIKEETSSDAKPIPKETTPPNIPNMNGDNTLLKALLKTAPKNAVSLGSPTVEGSVGTSNSAPVTLVASEVPIVLTQNMILNNQLVVGGKQEPTVPEAGVNSESTNSDQIKKKSKSVNKTAKQQTSGIDGKSLKFTNQVKSSTLKLNEVITASGPEQSNSMHIKNLLANSAIQNMLNTQQQQQQQATNLQNQPNANLIVNTNLLTAAEAANKIRKRKNNSNMAVNKLIVNQKENSLSGLSSPNQPIQNSSNNNLNSAENTAIRIFEQFKSMAIIQMSQPSPNTNQFSVTYPGKQHSNLLKKTNKIRGKCFELEIENLNNASGGKAFQMDKKFIDYILSENGIFSHKKEENETNLLKNISENLMPVREVVNFFRVCTAKIDKPSLVEIEKNNIVKPSSYRIRDILDLAPSPMKPGLPASRTTTKTEPSEAPLDNKPSDLTEYLKKSLKNDLNEETDFDEEALSPIVALSDNGFVKTEPTLDNSQSLNQNQTSVTIKLSKRACKDIKNTLGKIADLMLVACPSQWDLGRMVVNTNVNDKILAKEISTSNGVLHNKTDAVNNAPATVHELLSSNGNGNLTGIIGGSSLSKQDSVGSAAKIAATVYNETLYNMSTLFNSLCFKSCKFCESYLIDGKSFSFILFKQLFC